MQKVESHVKQKPKLKKLDVFRWENYLIDFLSDHTPFIHINALVGVGSLWLMNMICVLCAR
jgi:hypothetical protein